MGVFANAPGPMSYISAPSKCVSAAVWLPNSSSPFAAMKST
jgi:hypothetical protein